MRIYYKKPASRTRGPFLLPLKTYYPLNAINEERVKTKFTKNYRKLNRKLLALAKSILAKHPRFRVKKIALILLCSLTALISDISAEILTVGNDGDGYDYSTLSQAARDAVPGDSILLFGTFGGDYVENLKGSDSAPITITSGTEDYARYEGSSQAIHFVNPENLKISRLEFVGQTANGVNIDDGGDYSTPTRNIIIEDCLWLGMNASGNNDELKMSGVDNFTIRNCRFADGSGGGSMIDMVGCHYGTVEDCVFERCGSNAIQMKGGTARITVSRNLFLDAGYRSLNIGGSTGEPYFRPFGAPYESAEILVYSNVFIGSQAAIAYVGTINSKVVNNTIYMPDKWAIRILQENTGEGMEVCSDNLFQNNIVVVGEVSSVYTLNIGPNTAPETFVFKHNLWQNVDVPDWSGPNLPVAEQNGILNESPMFVDPGIDWRLQAESPAIGKGEKFESVEFDFFGRTFGDPPSIGAVEGAVVGSAIEALDSEKFKIYPNPAREKLFVEIYDPGISPISISVFGISSTRYFRIFDGPAPESIVSVDLTDVPTGAYVICLQIGDERYFETFVVE